MSAIDQDLLRWHLAEGNINEVRHPSEPLRLYNYTQRCQFAGAWDAVTRACRGLIVDDNHEIVARPFPKFHNLHEHGVGTAAGPIELVPPLRVYDKLDGSLGIAYRRPSDGSVAWATRGSFTSEQAEWATAWWAEHHASAPLPIGLTWLAEIIYPENRIVVDYGDRAELVLLAALDNLTGEMSNPMFWPGRTVELLGEVDDIAALDRNDRANVEGYVVVSGDLRTRVKLKADEYMRLHKLLTGVSNVTVWELLRDSKPLDDLLDVVPDEFADWVRSTVESLAAEHAALMARAEDRFADLHHLLPDRKAFAAEAVQDPDTRALLFALADGKDAAGIAWRAIKPERALPFNPKDTP